MDIVIFMGILASSLFNERQEESNSSPKQKSLGTRVANCHGFLTELYNSLWLAVGDFGESRTIIGLFFSSYSTGD